VVRRAAFTLIELVFAIVIIAIAVVSLPMMNQAISKGVDANLVQEAIFAAATELNEAITAHWDGNSVEPSLSNSYARVINIGGDCNTTTKLRPGQIDEAYHRRCLNDTGTTPVDAADTGVIALEDMAHDKQQIFINNVADEKGYKKHYTSKIEVYQNTNSNQFKFNGTYNKNMKQLVITIEDSDNPGVALTSLKTYSANIGEVDYYKKVYY